MYFFFVSENMYVHNFTHFLWLFDKVINEDLSTDPSLIYHQNPYKSK